MASPTNHLDHLSTLVGDVYLTSTDPWVVAYSGGKDSSVVLDLFMKAAERHPDCPHIYVVSNNTRVESPLVIDHLKSMHRLIQRHIDKCGLNMSVHMTEPPLNDSFWVNLIGKGYPTPNQMFRWCTSRLKIDPTSAFLDRAIGRKNTVIAVGTRSAESATRKQKIEKYAISEFFSTHTTRKNADLFMPIRHLTDDDVWEYLVSVSSPWGGDYFDLINLYREAYGGECPVVADASALSQPSCGEKSPRFGCWTCTLVKNDSSLQGLIDTGYEELKPLYDFRNWLIETRNGTENRLTVNRRGQVRYRSGRLVLGPYNLSYRKAVLEKLVQLQTSLQSVLITESEIEEIQSIWRKDERFLSRYAGCKIPANRSLSCDSFVEALMLEAAHESVSQFFKQRDSFVVGHYQRGISWEAEHINRMLADINFAINQSWREYFLGTVTLMSLRKGRYEVIDGQQRITALTLLLNYFAEYFTSEENPGSPRIAEKACQLIGAPPKAQKLFYKNTDENENYVAIIRRGNYQSWGTTHINELKASIDSFFQNLEETEIARFAEYVLNNIVLVVIRAKDARLTNQIFETLNATGKRLEEIDLIRNKVFRELRDSEVEPKAEIWGEMREDLIGQFKTSKRVDKHIQNVFKFYLRSYFGDWVEETELKYKLAEIIADGDDSTAGQLVDLICGPISSTAYCRLMCPADGLNGVSVGLPEAIQNFTMLEVGLPFGYTMIRLGFDPVTLEKNLRLSNAFIKRYWIVREKMPEARIGTFFSELASQLIDGVSEEASTEHIRNQMLGFDKQGRDQVLTDKIFIERVATQQAINLKKATHIFVSILKHQARRAGELFENSQDKTIEHILPQEWDPKLPVGATLTLNNTLPCTVDLAISCY